MEDDARRRRVYSGRVWRLDLEGVMPNRMVKRVFFVRWLSRWLRASTFAARGRAVQNRFKLEAFAVEFAQLQQQMEDVNKEMDDLAKRIPEVREFEDPVAAFRALKDADDKEAAAHRQIRKTFLRQLAGKPRVAPSGAVDEATRRQLAQLDADIEARLRELDALKAEAMEARERL